jgi:hypothetical protein
VLSIIVEFIDVLLGYKTTGETKPIYGDLKKKADLSRKPSYRLPREFYNTNALRKNWESATMSHGVHYTYGSKSEWNCTGTRWPPMTEGKVELCRMFRSRTSVITMSHRLAGKVANDI